MGVQIFLLTMGVYIYIYIYIYIYYNVKSIDVQVQIFMLLSHMSIKTPKVTENGVHLQLLGWTHCTTYNITTPHCFEHSKKLLSQIWVL